MYSTSVKQLTQAPEGRQVYQQTRIGNLSCYIVPYTPPRLLSNLLKNMRTIFSISFLLLLISNPSPAAPPHFTSVTKEAGIHFKHHDGANGQLYFIEPLGGGVAFLDYNNDGFQDIYLVNGAALSPLPKEQSDRSEPPQNALYRNNGDGTFTDVTVAARVANTGYGMGCAVGDYNNDGFPDLYVTNFGANAFFHNNGDGTFTNVTAETGTGDTRWGASCAL